MGLVKRLFGGKKTGGSTATAGRSGGAWRQCEKCGAVTQVSSGPSMSIFSPDIGDWSLEGMSGYCPSCGKFLCSKHLKFHNPSGGEIGPWEVVCAQHLVRIVTP
jgi:hypothetical protein